VSEKSPENLVHSDACPPGRAGRAASSAPPKLIVSDNFYEILLHKRAQSNEYLASQGLPPRTDELPYISESEANILAEAHAKRRATAEAASLGRLTRAARLKIVARSQSNPAFERHARKCSICRHPECDSIESDFISWRSETTIARNYRLPSRSSIYRHAAAAGLLQRRRLNLRGVCERIIERVDEAPPSGLAVLRALRIYSQITEDGNWVEPPKHSLVTHVYVTDHPPAGNGHSEGTAFSSSSLPSRVGCGEQADVKNFATGSAASPAPEILIGTQNANGKVASE